MVKVITHKKAGAGSRVGLTNRLSNKNIVLRTLGPPCLMDQWLWKHCSYTQKSALIFHFLGVWGSWEESSELTPESAAWATLGRIHEKNIAEVLCTVFSTRVDMIITKDRLLTPRFCLQPVLEKNVRAGLRKKTCHGLAQHFRCET